VQVVFQLQHKGRGKWRSGQLTFDG